MKESRMIAVSGHAQAALITFNGTDLELDILLVKITPEEWPSNMRPLARPLECVKGRVSSSTYSRIAADLMRWTFRHSCRASTGQFNESAGTTYQCARCRSVHKGTRCAAWY
jgi:hypothetical protein